MDQTQHNAERFNADEQIANLERQLRGDIEVFISNNKDRTRLLNNKVIELETKLKELHKAHNEKLDEAIKLRKENVELQKTVEELREINESDKKLLGEQFAKFESENALLILALSNANQELESIRTSTYTSNTTGPLNNNESISCGVNLVKETTEEKCV